MNRKNVLPILLLAVALTACTTVYTGIVTLTSVVDSAMKNWAALSVAGKTTPIIDTKVVAAHDTYRKACAVAQSALVAYKTSGNDADYLKALEAARAAAGGLIDLIVPLLDSQTAATLKAKQAKATAL